MTDGVPRTRPKSLLEVQHRLPATSGLNCHRGASESTGLGIVRTHRMDFTPTGHLSMCTPCVAASELRDPDHEPCRGRWDHSARFSP